MTQKQEQMISQGVAALIERLKTEGVSAGKQEAEKMIHDAQNQAEKILNDARKEAEKLMQEGHEKIQKEKRAAVDALQLAARNMRLELRQRLIDRFMEEVKRLVHKELANEATIRQLILIIAIDHAEQLQKVKEKEIEIELPTTVLDFEEIRKNPKLLENDPLKKLVQGVTSEMLRKGVSVKINKDKSELGIKVRIKDEGIEMDLTEEAISELLLKHMQPRFRALLEGLLQ